MGKKNFIPFTDVEQEFIEKIIEKRDKSREKFHLAYALAATFGIISVFYGFEKMIDRVHLFVIHPWILLLIGIIILAITGSIYKKLD